MFQFISQITTQYRFAIIIFWIVAVVAITLTAPSLDDVTTDDNSRFLPDDSISTQGQALVEEHFPAVANSGTVVVVFDAGEGGDVTSEDNLGFMEQVSTELLSDERVKQVDSAALVPETRDLLVSPNNRVGIVVASMPTGIDEDDQIALIEHIGEQISAAPEGLEVFRTGQLFTSLQYTETIRDGVGSTAIITISLVAVILLTIFRSPVSPLIPLSIVTIALLVTQGIVAFLGVELLVVPSVSTVLLIVVIYGAGTDYCLFLISRFREELGHSEKMPAARTTVERIGESISNSAATTTTGFLAMAFTQFGFFNTSGPILAIGIVVTLLASMTLTPAILSIFGQRVFFPIKITGPQDPPRISVAMSRFIKRYPAPIAVVLISIGVILTIYGAGYTMTFNFLNDLPQDAESVASFRLLEDEIGPGNLQPLTIVAEVEDDSLYQSSADLAALMLAVDGVADVRGATQPLGANHQTTNVTRMDTQLNMLASITTPADSEPTEEQITQIGNLIAALPDYLTTLTEYAPELAEDPAFADALDAIERSSAEPQLADLSSSLGRLAESAPAVHVPLTEIPSDVTLFFGGDLVMGLTSGYVNAESQIVRFDVILADDPYGNDAIDTLDELRGVIEDASVDSGITGTTALNLDLRLLIDSDLQLTIFLVLTGIFIILVLMLRSLVAPIYLIGTIALSFGGTLGLTRMATGPLFGEEDLVFWVPFMIFVFLVALGIDYSIFLFSRIKEELKKDGDITESIFRAIGSTGSIIASAGAIVAGSFVALTTTDIVGLNQVGFAVGVGILIDTIIIRTILVPAIAILVGRWSWFPGPLMKTIKTPEKQPVSGLGEAATD